MILETSQVFDKIKYHIDNKKPLSLVRYGDGEAIILNGFMDLKAMNFVFRRQFGFSPPIEHAEQIRENLINTYKECDIIGIPTRERFNSPASYWTKAKSILERVVHENILTDKTLCSIDVHSHFLDHNLYEPLLTGADTINYVSCRNLDNEIKNHFKVKTVNSFIIAPESKFTSGYKGNPHYPNQFNQIQKWMAEAINCEGAVCLVGAGVVGKVYCNWFRDMGGVAIDIGSVFDSWAGRATRGEGRGLDAIDKTFKL